MLRAAGAPTVESELVSDIRLMTGTFWHRYVGSVLVERGVPFIQEVKLDRWLPKGWSGTADWLFWNQDVGAFALGDLKTTKGEAIRFIRQEGMKLEHIWQLSAYWHALAEAGIPLIKGVSVLYLPMNNTTDKQERIEPIVVEADPLSRDEVYSVMEDRWERTREYLLSTEAERDRWESETGSHRDDYPGWGPYVTAALAPEQDRVQKVWWNKAKGVFDVKLVPHWSAAFCPYPAELCACNEQKNEKIGEWSIDLEYAPRKGYESIEALAKPDARDVAKRKKELDA